VLEETVGCGGKIRRGNAELRATISYTNLIYSMKKLNMLIWVICIVVL